MKVRSVQNAVKVLKRFLNRQIALTCTTYVITKLHVLILTISSLVPIHNRMSPTEIQLAAPSAPIIPKCVANQDVLPKKSPKVNNLEFRPLVPWSTGLFDCCQDVHSCKLI